MVVLDTAANLTTTWLLSTVLNNSVVRLLRASVASRPVNPRSAYLCEDSLRRTAKGEMKIKKAAEKKKEEEEKYKNTRADETIRRRRKLRPKRFLTIGIYGVRADYSARRRRRSATATTSGARVWGECTLHQQAREKNDERVYARLNLFNVETCWAVVGCLEIIKAIQH